MKFHLHFFAAVIIVTVIFTSCDPTQKQLAKEKERTETSVKQGIEPLQKDVDALKNEIKIAELKSELALAQIKLENIQKPREFKTQDEQNNEINSLNSKIEELQNAINSLGNTTSATDSTAKK